MVGNNLTNALAEQSDRVVTVGPTFMQRYHRDFVTVKCPLWIVKHPSAGFRCLMTIKLFAERAKQVAFQVERNGVCGQASCLNVNTLLMRGVGNNDVLMGTVANCLR